MTIYISTGGFSKKSANLAIADLERYGFKNIELSGGPHKKNLFYLIKNKKLNFQIHNYFPPPKVPFVLNLASLDKKIYKKSLNLVLKAINFSRKIKLKGILLLRQKVAKRIFILIFKNACFFEI